MAAFARLLGLPTAASEHASQVDAVIGATHILMIALFLGWFIFFIYLLIRFRRSRQPTAIYQGTRSHAAKYIEYAIVVAEVALLFGLSVPVWSRQIANPVSADQAQTIRVIGQQFAWNIHYPGPDGVFGKTSPELVDEAENPIGIDRSDDFAKDDVFTVNQLHIPVNTPINISLSTKDVIHNFKLTELRVSQDAIPGMEIPVWFEATMTSEEFLRTTEGSAREGKGFEIACAQLCGLGHYRMKGFLTVHNDEGYAAWLQEQQEYLEEEEDDDWGDDEW